MELWRNIRKRAVGLRARVGEFGWYVALFLGVQMVVSLVNVYTGLWLIPQVIPQADLGAVLPLLQLTVFLAMPLSLVLTPVGKYLNTFMAKGETGKARALLLDACRISLVAAVVMVAYTLVVAPFLLLRMRVNSSGVMLVLLCAMAFLSGVKPVLTSATQALKKFDNMLAGSVAVAPLRLVLIWVLAGSFGVSGYVGAQFGVELAGALIAIYGLRRVLAKGQVTESYRMHWREMFAFSVPLIACTVAGTLVGFVDPLVIRHRLPEVESAAYYIITRFSEIPGYLGGVLGLVLFPLVSERFEQGLSTGRLLRDANILNVVLGGALVVVLFWGGEWILHLRPAWAAYTGYARFMGPLGFLQWIGVPISAFILHETACRRFGYLWICSAIMLIKTGLLYCLTGWAFFQPYLPAAWWESVNRVDAARLDFIVPLFLVTQITMLLIMAGILVRRHYRPARTVATTGQQQTGGLP